MIFAPAADFVFIGLLDIFVSAYYDKKKESLKKTQVL